MLTLVIFATCVALVLWATKGYKRSNLPYPPGPPADPVLGHMLKFPLDFQEDTFLEWSRRYGDVMHLHIPGRSIIILSSIQAATDLLEKRSAIYSDRPRCLIFELMGWTRSLTFLPYGQLFRIHRQMYQEYFGPKMVKSHQKAQMLEAHRLIKDLLTNPGDHDDAFLRFSSSVIMQVGYGHEPGAKGDRYAEIVGECMSTFDEVGPPGNTPVDLMPFLQYMPSWFPGTYYANKGRQFRRITQLMHDFPFDDVKRQMAEGTAEPSFLSYFLKKLERNDEIEEDTTDVKGAAATMYAAGADTTWTTLSVFLLAIILFPECQLKAQEEIDAVVGKDRLPDFSDRLSLPYVERLVQETFRWCAALPLGVPHLSTADDVYNGYFIPKGSVVIYNAKAMSLDEKTYAEPSKFDPDRFLRGEPLPVAQYGFGRRACVGKYLADQSVWAAIASIVAVCSVSKALDESGQEIIPDCTQFRIGSLTRHPAPYKCVIQPRSDKAMTMAMDSVETR